MPCLPNEIMEKIISYVPLCERTKIEKTSQYFRLVSRKIKVRGVYNLLLRTTGSQVMITIFFCEK